MTFVRPAYPLSPLSFPIDLSLPLFPFQFLRFLLHYSLPLSFYSSGPPCLGHPEFFFWKPILPGGQKIYFTQYFFYQGTEFLAVLFYFKFKNIWRYTQYQVMNCLDSFHGWFRFKTDYPIEICRSHTLDWLFGKIT